MWFPVTELLQVSKAFSGPMQIAPQLGPELTAYESKRNLHFLTHGKHRKYANLRLCQQMGTIEGSKSIHLTGSF